MNDAFLQVSRVLIENRDRLVMHIDTVHGNDGVHGNLLGFLALDPWMLVHTDIHRYFKQAYQEEGIVFVQTASVSEAAKLFDISWDDAANLFFYVMDVPFTITRQMVYRNIQAILNGEPTLSYSEMKA